MNTHLPDDANGRAIPALAVRAGGDHHLSATTASVAAGPFGAATRVVTVIAAPDIYYRTGDGAVAAASPDHWWPAYAPLDLALGLDDAGTRHTHLAVRRAGTVDGTVHVSERV